MAHGMQLRRMQMCREDEGRAEANKWHLKKNVEINSKLKESTRLSDGFLLFCVIYMTYNIMGKILLSLFIHLHLKSNVIIVAPTLHFKFYAKLIYHQVVCTCAST